MNHVNEGALAVAEVLLSSLDEITAELERCVGDGDVEWLRPLLLLHAEIEFTATRARRLDVGALAGECRDLDALLTRTPSGADDFAARYASTRVESPRLRSLHGQGLGACRALLAALSSQGEAGTSALTPI